MTSISQRFYLLGYSGKLVPRQARAIFLRSTWHRAWLSGYTGVFFEGENEKQFGVLDRQWYAYRKGSKAPEHVGFMAFMSHMLKPFSQPNN